MLLGSLFSLTDCNCWSLASWLEARQDKSWASHKYYTVASWKVVHHIKGSFFGNLLSLFISNPQYNQRSKLFGSEDDGANYPQGILPFDQNSLNLTGMWKTTFLTYGWSCHTPTGVLQGKFLPSALYGCCKLNCLTAQELCPITSSRLGPGGRAI